MVNIYICTDEKDIWFGEKAHVIDKMPEAKRWCMEMMSDTMFEALMAAASVKETQRATADILYYLLSKNALHDS